MIRILQAYTERILWGVYLMIREKMSASWLQQMIWERIARMLYLMSFSVWGEWYSGRSVESRTVRN